MVVAPSATARRSGLPCCGAVETPSTPGGHPFALAVTFPARGNWAAAASLYRAPDDRTPLSISVRPRPQALTAAMFADASGASIGQEPEGRTGRRFPARSRARRGYKRWGTPPGTKACRPRDSSCREGVVCGAHANPCHRRSGSPRTRPQRRSSRKAARRCARETGSSRRISPDAAGDRRAGSRRILQGPIRPRGVKGTSASGVMTLATWPGIARSRNAAHRNLSRADDRGLPAPSTGIVLLQLWRCWNASTSGVGPAPLSRCIASRRRSAVLRRTARLPRRPGVGRCREGAARSRLHRGPGGHDSRRPGHALEHDPPGSLPARG